MLAAFSFIILCSYVEPTHTHTCLAHHHRVQHCGLHYGDEIGRAVVYSARNGCGGDGGGGARANDHR